MQTVSAKKHLGQHFLKDKTIAKQIVDSLKPQGRYKEVLEIGPGMGVLTKYLFTKEEFHTSIIEIDKEAISFLKKHFPENINQVIEGDFLALKMKERFDEPFAIIGN